jgi:L-seryl-tRNA(Ser) seleniumtransferase
MDQSSKVNPSSGPAGSGDGKDESMQSDPRRNLPGVDRLAREMARRSPDLPDWSLREGARQAVGEARERITRGDDPALELTERGLHLAAALHRPSPTRVVNATGVVLHTNLGRAVLAPGAARAAAEAAAAYSDLELDLESGERGDRLARVATLLRLLSGAEAAMAVNNNAAAVLLAVNSVAGGREVVVSRGELVEIGGSFRVPEILAQAGVRLVEVGTTNRTHPEDYRGAIGAETGLLLKVHRSNFEQRGFVTEVELPALVEIGREAGVPVVEDLGSGTLLDLRARGLPPDSFAPARLASGVDLVCFSGDKLLGGPQAGIVLGSAEAVRSLRRNPLARALRLDKMSLAALDWTLRAVAEGRAEQEIPTLRQLGEPLAAVEKRARELRSRLDEVADTRITVELEETRAPVGGGSLPGFELPSRAVTLRGAIGAELLCTALRRGPVLARVRDDRVQLDARTLLPGDETVVASALRRALEGVWAARR